MSCLIGYTGFVGSNLMNQSSFDYLYNSKNIEEIKGKKFDLVVCAGAPAVKWKANQQPEEDLSNINYLIQNLQDVDANKFILISTVDVYQVPTSVDEDTDINPEGTDPYGRHRYYLEQFVKQKFKDYLIVRLPGLYGNGLKKNFIYDLIHDNCLHLTHYESEFQFYSLDDLWRDITIAMNHNVSLINFCPEPVKPAEIAAYCLQTQYMNITEKPPVHYDMRSKYSSLYNSNSVYMKGKYDVLEEIKQFIHKEKLK